MTIVYERQHGARRRTKIKRRRRRMVIGWVAFLFVGTLIAGAVAVFVGITSPRKAQSGVKLIVDTKNLMDTPFIYQREKYPTGCESVSAVMALQYLGQNITPEEFIDSYLPKGNAPYRNQEGELVGCDPREAFPGDPYSHLGWGCYSPVIEKAVNLAGAKEGITATAMTGQPLDALCEDYVEKGIPVIIIASIDMAPVHDGDTWTIEGTGETFTWLEPMHCVLLTGSDDKYYYVNDPLVGKNTPYPKELVAASYSAMGEQSVSVMIAAGDEMPAQKDESLLVLVNGNNPLPEDWSYTPVMIGEEQVDERIYDPLSAMIDAAAEEGITLWVASGYRSTQDQEAILSRAVENRQNQGMGEQEALENALRTIARPGYSEHHTGLAVDFGDVSREFEFTDAYGWLSAHSAEYGFVQRYKTEKSHITGIDNESWHYRYVGKEQAEEMERLDMCLEEYVDYLKNQEAQ